MEDPGALPRFQAIDLSRPDMGLHGAPQGVFSAASQGTTYFGGTFWNADSARWQALRDSVWTFDSGVGSHYDHSAPHVNPYKNTTLHAYMEGWIGFDNTFAELTYFRRVGVPSTGETRWTGGTVCVGDLNPRWSTFTPTPISGGDYSFWCGVFPGEADEFCYSDGQGYGNSWNVCMGKTLFYNGSGSAVLEYDYDNETEAGFDFTDVVVDTTGAGDDVVVVSYDGTVTGHATHALSSSVNLPSVAGDIVIKFCFSSDGAWSDEDGLLPTDCGAFTVDNIRVTGGAVSPLADFETDPGGWELLPPEPGSGGDWSNIVHLNDLPPYNTVCPCNLSDSVLVFEDLDVGGHNEFQDNIAASPWIDLRAAGLVETPGKFIEANMYADLPLLNYTFYQFLVQWYPDICLNTGKALTSPWTSYWSYFYPYIRCTNEHPIQINFGYSDMLGAEQVRIAVGVLSYCRFFANCTGMSNSTPWYDDVRFGVFGSPDAPNISVSTVDIPQDSFPEDGTLNIRSPGRIDANNVKGDSQPETGTALGDTLIVDGGQGGAEVHVQFAIHAGPGIDQNRLDALYSKTTYEETKNGLDWYSARLDTAELGSSGPINGTWMTTFHEDAPGFSGTDRDLDPSDLDPNGVMTRLENDIFPDDLLTPGSRLNLFYKSRFTNGTSWFTNPDTTGGNYHEMEVLPSSMAADSTFNCVLYVDHFDGRGAQPFIENALAAILPAGSANQENTAWDRWNVRAASSQQASFGRPVGTEYGATLVQALGYKTILWNSGNLNAFCLTKEDADVLIPWLLLPDFAGNSLYLNGDGVVASGWNEAALEPSARRLLEDLAGVSFACGTFRDENCPSSSPVDATVCVDIDPVAGAVVSTRPLGATPLGQGNGCPDQRSFDVIFPTPSPQFGSPRAEEKYVGGVKTAQYASISNQMGASGESGMTAFKTVVDGVSVHHRRDPGACTFLTTSPPVAVEDRLREVLDWFGPSGYAGDCRDNTAGIGIGEDVTGQDRFPIALANIAPNPLRGGAPGRITFTLPEPQRATVSIFDLGGRLVRMVFDGEGREGPNEIVWDGTDGSSRRVASGVYFYRLETQTKTFSKKLVVVRGGR